MTSPLLFRFRICRLFRTDKITGRSFVYLRGGKAIALPYRGCDFGGRVKNPVILSVSQSAADFPISMIAGGNHTSI